MATESPFLVRMQRASHWISCGHTRPVTQGSALSPSRLSAAEGRSPSRRNLMKRGMSTRTGQPSTQNGLGHWMQRSASSSASS